MPVAETIFLCSDARDLRILGVQGKLFVEGKMGTACRSARVHCLPVDMIRRVVCWMGLTPSASRWDGAH
jgi:hypothetical protein